MREDHGLVGGTGCPSYPMADLCFSKAEPLERLGRALGVLSGHFVSWDSMSLHVECAVYVGIFACLSYICMCSTHI